MATNHWNSVPAPQTQWIHEKLVTIQNSIWYSTSYYYGAKGMVEFDCKTNKIVRKIQYPNGIYPHDHSCCSHGNNIYIIDGTNGKIILFNTTTHRFTTKLERTALGAGVSTVIIGDNIHIFNGSDNTKHLIYSIQNNTIQSINDTTTFTKLTSVCLLEYEGKIIKFGGHDFGKEKCVDSFYMSSSVKNINDIKVYIQPQYKLPRPLFYCGAVIFDHYLIIFGGAVAAGKYSDAIYVLDLDGNKGWIKLQHIKCPLESQYRAILDNDNNIHLITRLNKWPNWESSIIKHYVIPIQQVLGDMYDEDDESEDNKCSECDLLRNKVEAITTEKRSMRCCRISSKMKRNIMNLRKSNH